MIRKISILIGIVFIICSYCCSPVIGFNDTNAEALVLAKDGLHLIRQNDIDSFISLTDKDLSSSVNFRELLDSVRVIINNNIFPSDSLVKISSGVTITQQGKAGVATIVTFPFRKEDPTDIVEISVATSSKNIVQLAIGRPNAGKNSSESKVNDLLTSHSFSLDDLSWFRIWYGSGYKENEYGDKYGYYAVSGGQQKINDCGIKELMEELFQLLNEADIDSTDTANSLLNYRGNSEYILFRFKFKNAPYSELGEVKLRVLLEEQPGISERMVDTDFVLLFHSRTSRQWISKELNPELVKKIQEITYREYGSNQENRTY